MPKTEELEEAEKPGSNLSEVKIDPERRQHVPYILNGELYRIESQIGDNVTVKCCSCPPDRIYRGSVRSTGNFHMHIKRRHASLLGKLHEMKVAALVERRDRIMKNRRIAKCRKKSTSSVAISALAAITDGSSIEVPNSTETHELKIKTVFQRHKQEHHEQEEAAAIRTSISISDSSTDNSQSSEKLSVTASNQDNNNNNNINSTQDNNNSTPNNNIHNNNHIQGVQSPSTLSSTMLSPTFVPSPQIRHAIDFPAMVSIPRMLAINAIKPEQQPQALYDQPEAIDLSRSSSMQSDDMEHGRFTQEVQNVQIGVSRGQELTPFVNGPPRDILMRIDNTLADIKDELQARNEIERKRLLFDVAKFQFLHPNFNFESSS
ncbi:PREDICTED: protein stand still [Drosophila arizonae]|uniref:Protein stand still n=1 Tax=Drosophila arizonae TaxID=7263 RepID=A0ABM1PBN0_DROAR|nr:PREDICTED: protein stand still [Drosophila arizonae]